MSILINTEDCKPHVATHVCGKCRKPFEQGHRICSAHIFDRRGANPANLGNVGAFIFEEFEFVHIDCHDPFLKKGLYE